MRQNIFTVILFICVFTSCVFINHAQAEDEYGIPEYEVLSTEDISTSNKIRATVKVLVPKVEKQHDLELIIRELVNVARNANPRIDAISFFFYATPDQSWLLGTGTWAPEGKFSALTDRIARQDIRIGYKITAEINQSAVEAIKARAKEETKFDLSEKERRKINWDLAVAEDRAWFEADVKYLAPMDCYTGPDLREKTIESRNKYMALQSKLEEKYREQVMEKYGIDEEIERGIRQEFFIEQWPLPESREVESGC